MKVLVTGSTGFLGRQVVDALLRRGVEVRAMVRPHTDIGRFEWADRVQVVRCDLRATPEPELVTAFNDIDAVIHLAAGVGGSDEGQFAASAVGTERLLAAMRQSSTRRMVFASSFSVYDWDRTGRRLDESSPIEKEIYDRDGYAIAKIWQERLVRRAAESDGLELTVLRPGFIWSTEQEWCPGLGDVFGSKAVVVGPLRRLPLTHVYNTADCFAAMLETVASIGETFNVVDGHRVSAWRWARDLISAQAHKRRRLPMPYHLGLMTAYAARCVSRVLFGPTGKLPSILVPKRYVARFKCVKFPNEHLVNTTGWQPPLDYRHAVDWRQNRASPASTEPRATVAAVCDSEAALTS